MQNKDRPALCQQPLATRASGCRHAATRQSPEKPLHGAPCKALQCALKRGLGWQPVFLRRAIRGALLLVLSHWAILGAAAADDRPSPACPDGSGLAAHQFGLKIQDAVRERDLAAFFALVDGELKRGPSRGSIQGKAFREVFSDAWREAILQQPPPCEPLGWRGFMLGSGELWYRPGQVFALNGWAPEGAADDDAPALWMAEGRRLSPQCFAYPSLSGDLLEHYARRFSIAKHRSAPEFADFEANPGRYFGDPIGSFAQEAGSLWQYLEDCAEANDAPPAQRQAERYAVLAEVAAELCQRLAPDLPGECLESRLLHRFSSSGGSMGYHGTHGIYGLFRLARGERIIFPLKYFDSENLARSFLDQQGRLSQPPIRRGAPAASGGKRP